MIDLNGLYTVLTAVVPLYVAMFLAYASVKWWNIFSPEQCGGINKFIAIFAIPLLSFDFISRVNPYKMNFRFIAADGISKAIVLVALILWANFSKRGSFDWAITAFSLSTLQNTLVLGIPFLKSMYGEDKESIMIQAIALQCIVWYTLLLFLFEYRIARNMILNGNSPSSCDNGTSTSSRGERSGESSREIQEKLGRSTDNEDDTVSVIMSTPSSNSQTTQCSCKVAPAAEVDGAKELHSFVWGCKCRNSPGICEQPVEICSGGNGKTEIPASGSTNLLPKILKIVCVKLARNPNSYASILGLSWALASCKWGIKKPDILDRSITILSDAGLGMAMFSLGLFMASQPKIIACGKRLAAYGMVARFLVGPAVMAVASIVVGLRGTILQVSILQSALPQGIVPFVFAREYNLHPDVLSTVVIFGMIFSLPITIVYYILLGL